MNIYTISLGSLVYYKTHPGSVTVTSQWHIYNLTVSTAFVKIGIRAKKITSSYTSSGGHGLRTLKG
jgi:hypothetical protein